MAIPRTPVTIATSDTFTTWLTNTNYAVDILKNIITDTVLTHSSGAYTLGETVSQSATSSTGIVRVAGATTTTVVTTAGAFNTGSAVVGATSSVSKTPSAVSASHLATTNAVLTTPTITAPVIATITNNSNTLTLPTSADTLVGRATTDTLTNKTLTSPAINGGTMTSVTLVSPTLSAVAGLTIANAANIGSVGDTDAMAISSGGVVTFSQRDVHSAGITVADAGQIGSASDTDAIAIGADGDVTLTQDLELQHDGAVLSFGANDDVTITHVHDDGIILRNTVSDFTRLAIHSSKTNVADGNLLGEISFRAIAEAAGGDAVLPAAAIAARSEGDFSATNNATELVFKTGASEDASVGASDGDMILSSAGNLTVAGTYNGGGIMTTGGNIVIPDAGTIGSATDTDAIAIGSDGDITLSQDLELQHDSATISMGANDDVVITHIADEGIGLTTTPTGTAGGTILHFKNNRTSIVDTEMIGRMLFQTPLESSGSYGTNSTAQIAVVATEAFTDAHNESAITFSFANDTNGMHEKFRFDTDGSLTIDGDAKLQHDAVVLSFGANDDVSLTHVHDTGLLLNSTMQLQFNDASQYINAPSNAILDINATDEIELNATLADINANLDVSGTGTFGGILKTDDATEATSTTDGSLQTDGGLSVVKDAVFGDDIKLLTDASVIHFGVDSEITVTHVVDKGLTIKNENTAGTSGVGGILTLATGDEDIADGNILGQIKFQAPDEGTGTDSVAVAGGIAVRSEGDFSTSNNATEMVFNTGLSGDESVTASNGSKGMVLSSTGGLRAGNFKLFGSLEMAPVDHGSNNDAGGTSQDNDIDTNVKYTAGRTHTIMTAAGSTTGNCLIGSAAMYGECHSGGTGNTLSNANPSATGQRIAVLYPEDDYGCVEFYFAEAWTGLMEMNFVYDNMAGNNNNDSFREYGYYWRDRNSASMKPLAQMEASYGDGTDSDITARRSIDASAAQGPQGPSIYFYVVAEADEYVSIVPRISFNSPYQDDVNMKTWVTFMFFG